MSFLLTGPTIGSAPADPIIIDPAVAYKFVLPVTGETSVSVAPLTGFIMSVVGRQLTFTYNGPALTADTDFTVTLTAANGIGTSSLDIPVRVRGGQVVQVDPSFLCAAVNASPDLRFGVATADVAHPLPINGRLAVNQKVKAVTLVSGTAPTGIAVTTVLYIVRVDDATGRFRVSATLGGGPITPDQAATFMFENAVGISGAPALYVGDSSRFTPKSPVLLTYTDGVAMPTGWTGAKFVSAILDPYHISISTASGGSAVNAAADSFASDEGVRLVADTTGGRAYPAITSDPEINITPGVAIAPYDIATDIPADSIQAQGLPPGFVLAGSTITGTPANTAAVNAAQQFAVILIAFLNGNASYRYLLLNVIGGVSLDPDFKLDIGSRWFYAPGGKTGRADRMEVVLGDAPQLIGIEQNANDFTFPEGAKLRLLVKTAVNGGTTLIDTEMTVPADAGTLLSIGEDWLAAGLTGLQFAAGYENLWAQYQWRFTSDPAGTYRKTTWFPLRVWANLAGGAVTTGPVSFIQTKPFTQISGNVPNVSLDSVLTLNLAVETWRAAVIINDGTRHESIWFLVAGTDATADGIQRPNDYAATTNEKVWVRVSGV